MFKKEDLAILDKLNLEVKPVAVGFLNEAPEGIEKEDYPYSLCEMPRRAREVGPFYTNHEEACPAASYFFGFTDVGNPTVTVTVYNASEVEVKSEEETIADNHNFTIQLEKQDFDNYGYGEWKVVVECENGNIQYDITVQIRYKE